MVEIPTYQIGIFVFDLTFSIEKKCAKTRPYSGIDLLVHGIQSLNHLRNEKCIVDESKMSEIDSTASFRYENNFIRHGLNICKPTVRYHDTNILLQQQ